MEFTNDQVIEAHEALKWFGEAYPEGYIIHEVKEHVPGKYIYVEAYSYDKNGKPLATNGRYKLAEHEQDDDYVGWAITQAIGRCAKVSMMLHGAIQEAHTGEEFSRSLQKKMTELNSIFEAEGQKAAEQFASEHNGAVGKRLRAMLNHLVSGSVMEPSDKPNSREKVKPGNKTKDEVPY